jgi:YD repeat-containing protein
MPDDEVLQMARARIGRVLLGKYRIERVLGVGGMATVYLANHRNNKQFAVKMLHPEVSQREHLRARFLREGYVANSVKHAGAVAVLDDDVAEDGSAFLVMELLEGSPVDELWVKHDKKMPLGLVLSIGDALLDVLAAAHARGIVHRDLKPPNLFLTHEGVLKVLDFGIARLLDETGAVSATVTGTMMGTPAFMAPEQALAKASDVDAQTDLWAAGATLFSLLAGQFVHAGDNASQLLVNAATKPARPVASVATAVPPAVAAVIDKALAFDKKDRWPKASAMRDALQAACVEATGAPIAALPRRAARSAERSGPGPRGHSSDAAFAPTVDSGNESGTAAARGVTTAGPVASTGSTVPERERRRPPWRAIVGVLGGVAVVAAGVAGYRAAHAPHLRTCALINAGIDGARCGLEVSAPIAGRRIDRTARITEIGGRVASLEWMNFRGAQPDSEQHDLYREEFVRDDGGQVREIVRRNRHGSVIRWEKWSERGRRIDLVDLDGTSPRVDGNTSISTIRREYDARGFVSRETYFGPTGKPAANVDGAYGLAFERGKLGRWTKAWVLASDGQPGVDERGMALDVRPDDDTPDGREDSYYGADGQPMTIEGVFREKRVYDDAFNCTDDRMFWLHDEPAVDLRSGSGAHAFGTRWDADRRVVERFAVDEHGHVLPAKGNSFAVLRQTYDDRGREILSEFLDGNGNRVPARGGGAAAIRMGWNDAGDEIERDYLDPGGALIKGQWGFARRLNVYDPRGLDVEQRYFDESGQPVPWKEGGAIARGTYDERRLVTNIAEYGGDEKPTADVHGVHETRRKFDRLRNEIEADYLGVDGQPTTNDEGVSIIRRSFDDSSNLVSKAYFDETGAPVMVGGELAAERFTYDDRGLRLSSEALDSHGERALRQEGYAVVRTVRDRNGEVVEESYFGKRDEPIACSGGYARKTIKVDVHRRPIETALFDAGGAPTIGGDGWAIERTTYDDRGLVVREDHLDTARMPVIAKDGAAAVARTWDSRGNLVAESTLGLDGKPVVASGGYATRRSEFDDRDQLIAESLFAADGTPVLGKDGRSMRRVRYDDVGNVVEEAYFDVTRAPVSPRDATYASVRHRYHGRQRLVETSFLDPSGAPGTGPEGAATVRYQRDGYGRAIETSYLDRTGAPTLSKDGKMVVRTNYDFAGRIVEERFLDGSAAPRPASDGCAAHRIKYDAHGRKTEHRCLDAGGALAMSTSGFAMQRIVHDGRGNDVEISTYGPDGQPCLDREGIARRRNRYDERNLVVDTTYFDAVDRPTHDRRGVHETRFAYGETGKPLPATYLDEHGRPVQR